ncbi:velvet complex subunit B-like [Lates japonicus]
MASSGPPRVDHLLTRIGRWIVSFAHGSFWPFNRNRSVAERPPDDREEDGHQQPEVGNRGPPLPLLPQFLPPPFWMQGQQHGPAVPFPHFYPAPYPVPFAVPHPVPYAPAHPYAFPYHAFHHAFPHAAPHAAPAFPHAAPAFPGPDPYAAPAFPHANPYAAPAPHPHALPHAEPYDAHAVDQPDFYGFPNDPFAVDQPDLHADPYVALVEPFDEDNEEDEDFMNGDIGTDDEVTIHVPDLDVENIGQLCPEDDSSDDSSSAEASVSPSTSGLSSSRRRRSEDGDLEGAPAKRPRWSTDSDSD